MRRLIVASLILIGFVALIDGQQQRAPSLLIKNITVIDGSGAPPRSGLDVLVRDGRIVSVGADGVGADGRRPEREASTERQAGVSADLTIDGAGLFALPGLIDAHVHLSGLPWDARRAQLSRVLRGGVTTVYDLASDLRNTSDLARAALAGEIESPRIVYAALFAGPAFFSDPRVVATSLGYRPGDAPWNREIRPDTDLVRAVAAARGAGAAAVKLYAALDGPTVRRIGDEARRQQLRLVAHATVFPAKPSDLVAAGVTMLAHSAYLVWEGMPPSPEFQKRARGDFAGVPPDGAVMTALLQSMKDEDVALNPTLWIFAEGTPKDDLTAARTHWMNAITKRAQDLGVVIAAGVDSVTNGNDPLPTIHKELELLVTGAGLTPLQAIAAATRGAAHAMGLDDQLGTIAPGRAADLLIVSADPAADIRNTRRIRYVIQNGRLVHAQAAER
jgi:imidazolonepropionase-like amidohydrolase